MRLRLEKRSALDSCRLDGCFTVVAAIAVEYAGSGAYGRHVDVGRLSSLRLGSHGHVTGPSPARASKSDRLSVTLKLNGYPRWAGDRVKDGENRWEIGRASCRERE